MGAFSPLMFVSLCLPDPAEREQEEECYRLTRTSSKADLCEPPAAACEPSMPWLGWGRSVCVQQLLKVPLSSKSSSCNVTHESLLHDHFLFNWTMLRTSPFCTVEKIPLSLFGASFFFFIVRQQWAALLWTHIPKNKDNETEKAPFCSDLSASTKASASSIVCGFRAVACRQEKWMLMRFVLS